MLGGGRLLSCLDSCCARLTATGCRLAKGESWSCPKPWLWLLAKSNWTRARCLLTKSREAGAALLLTKPCRTGLGELLETL